MEHKMRNREEKKNTPPMNIKKISDFSCTFRIHRFYLNFSECWTRSSNQILFSLPTVSIILQMHTVCILSNVSSWCRSFEKESMPLPTNMNQFSSFIELLFLLLSFLFSSSIVASLLVFVDSAKLFNPKNLLAKYTSYTQCLYTHTVTKSKTELFLWASI